jgi:hypothetical protein
MSVEPIGDSLLLTSDGVELATRSWSSHGEPRAIVILVHGLSSTKDHRTSSGWPNASGLDPSMSFLTMLEDMESPEGFVPSATWSEMMLPRR